MRDSHRIREEGAFGRMLAVLVRNTRTVFLVAAAFALGRATAPHPEGLNEPRSAGNAPTEPPVPAAEPAHIAPPLARELPKERKPKPLVVSTDPQALADGLLPEQLGAAKGGEFSVQLASFASRPEARAFCQQLTRRGFHPHVAESRPSSQPYRVRLGRFVRRELAQAYRIQLSQADITAAVVQVD